MYSHWLPPTHHYLEAAGLVVVPDPGNFRVIQLDNGSLAFFPARLGDFGHYLCIASNQAGSDFIEIIIFVAGEWLTITIPRL